jgi:UDP-N-acetylglucosamine:LPS N-acetylglucosamine transferase
VTFDTGRFTNIDSERRLYVTHPRKKIFRTIKNAYESLIILWKERPEVIISTGADVTVPTIIFGKVFFGAKVIFIESAGDLTPTLTGRIVYRFTDLFIIQWAEQFKYYPKAALSKGLLL